MGRLLVLGRLVADPGRALDRDHLSNWFLYLVSRWMKNMFPRRPGRSKTFETRVVTDIRSPGRTGSKYSQSLPPSRFAEYGLFTSTFIGPELIVRKNVGGATIPPYLEFRAAASSL